VAGTTKDQDPTIREHYPSFNFGEFYGRMGIVREGATILENSGSWEFGAENVFVLLTISGGQVL